VIGPVGRLLERWFPESSGELTIGGVAATALAERYGTPLFVYDQGIIEAKWRMLRDALPPTFSIFYSMKANPNRTVIGCLLEKGCGVEVASGGEFLHALDSGCPADRILFAGPGKSPAELDLALSRGIREIHIESVVEARRIDRIAQERGIRARVAVRVNPAGEAEGGAMRMGGRSAPFGVDEETLDGTVDEILALDGLELSGIHLFTGTQILDADVLITQYRKALDIARRVAGRLKHPLRTVDFGGGLGIPYFSHEADLDIGKLRELVAELMESIRGDHVFAETEFIVEPGRYLVGESGVYLARITDIKVSRGKKFLILDGGMNHHLAASGNLGQTIKRNYPIAIVNRLDSGAEEAVDIVGPLCTPLDTLGRAVTLPAAEIGDIVGVFQSGAYGRSASPLGFLSHPAPPEVWVRSGQHSLIREREALVGEHSREVFEAQTGR